VERAELSSEITSLRDHNTPAIAMLRERAPDLKSARGKHYADILQSLFEERSRRLAKEETGEVVAEAATAAAREQATQSSAPFPVVVACVSEVEALKAVPEDISPSPPIADLSTGEPGTDASASVSATSLEQPLPPPMSNPSRIALGPAIDKSVLALASPRRIRNKAHLIRVGSKACLICEESPCHAHHVTFAQPRGLSVKVSDEFTVPLCVVHHNEVHRARNEEAWWRGQGIDPLAAAAACWQETLATGLQN